MLKSKVDFLNDKTYNKDDFLSQLINEAIDLEIITEEMANNILIDFAKSLFNRADIVTESIESRIDEYKKMVMSNHVSVINWYLYTLTPSNAFDKFVNDASSLDKEAMKWFELHVSNHIKRLEDAKELLVAQRADTFMWDSYNYILKELYRILKYDIVVIDLNAAIIVPMYKTMNYFKIDTGYLLNEIQEYVDAFILEIKIRAAFGNAVKKIKSMKNAKVNNEIKNFFEYHKKQAERRAEATIRTKIKEFETENGKISRTEKERIKEVEDAKLDEYLDEKLVSREANFELDNVMIDVIIEYIFTVLSIETNNTVELPKELDERVEALKKTDKENVFRALFSHPELVEFSEEEEKYLKEHFLDSI